MRDHIALDVDAASLCIHLHDCRMAARCPRAFALRIPDLRRLEPVTHEIAQLDAAIRHATNSNPADVEHEILYRRFELLRRTFEKQAPRRRCGQRHRVADLDSAATPRRDKRESDVAAVAGSHVHAVDWPAEPVGGDLRDEGLVPLALRSAADENPDGAVRQNCHARGLRHANSCGLDAHRDAHPNRFAGELALADCRGADSFDGQLKESWVIAAAVRAPDASLLCLKP